MSFIDKKVSEKDVEELFNSLNESNEGKYIKKFINKNLELS